MKMDKESNKTLNLIKLMWVIGAILSISMVSLVWYVAIELLSK